MNGLNQTQIKKTKNIEMVGDKDGVTIQVKEFGGLFIPMRVVFQVKRGLESYVQKYYRRKK